MKTIIRIGDDEDVLEIRQKTLSVTSDSKSVSDSSSIKSSSPSITKSYDKSTLSVTRSLSSTGHVSSKPRSRLASKSEAQTNWLWIGLAGSVAFLESMHRNCIEPTVWPYMKEIDPDSSESFFGIIQGAQSLTNSIVSFIAGYICDKIYDTRPQLIAGTGIILFSCIVYLSVEFVFFLSNTIFVSYNVFMGIGLGSLSVYRTYIAMESEERHRAQACGLTQIAEAIGLLLAPVLQLLASLLDYPGWESPFFIHLNIYTTPILVTVFSCSVMLLCYIKIYNGQVTAEPAPTLDLIVGREVDESLLQPMEKDYDRLAFVVLIIAKVAAQVILLTFNSITALYAMNVFAWTGEELIIFQSILLILYGIASICIGGGYIFFKLDQRVSERASMVVSYGIFLSFFLVTYPWFFIEETIPYEHLDDGEPIYNQTLAILFVAQENVTDDMLVGCRVEYNWCAATPRVDVLVYNVALFVAAGFAMPWVQLNMDILLSKVLGPINQGLEQAAFNASAMIVNIIGPFIFTAVYEYSGPILLWRFELVVSLALLILLLVTYNRLVPYSQRYTNKVAHKSGSLVKIIRM